MHPYTKAIEAFEAEAERIRKEFLDTPRKGYILEPVEVENRDAQLARCQWAIDILNEAYRKEQKAVKK